MPRRQPLPGPQRTAAPREVMFPAERKERQEQNQSGVEEREAEKTRRNRRARLNLAPPMGSVAAQRQVTISKLGPCSPGWWEGERVEGLEGSYADVLGDSGGGCPLSWLFQETCPQHKFFQHTPTWKSLT